MFSWTWELQPVANSHQWVDQSETGSASHTIVISRVLPSQFHSYTFSAAQLFLWFRLLAFEANVSSVWFKWVFLFLCILNFLLYFNLGDKRVRLVALWVHLKKNFIYSVYLFFNMHFNKPFVAGEVPFPRWSWWYRVDGPQRGQNLSIHRS